MSRCHASRTFRSCLHLLIAVLPAAVTLCACHRAGPGLRPRPSTRQEAGGNCLTCHAKIEDAHPKRLLYCTDCHGGDDRATDRSAAHVQPAMPMPRNPTILPQTYPDLPYLRFVNPSNLRIVRATCGKARDGWGGGCHAPQMGRVLKSMMATTTGHLTGGAYENGILRDRTARWGNMPVADTDGYVPVERGAIPKLDQVPPEDTSLAFGSFERHYTDVPRKICARCHLWSRGKAVRGVPGQEGNYRSEGCAACHMPYANDGLSKSADPTIPKTEVGHPLRHEITRRIPTEQCVHCHTRGARIGLSYQGLAQLPPGTPTGPSYPGLTPSKIYGAYHVQDPAVNPPDIHFERGMHCIDCHVQNEIMGDGNIYSHMDQATEIECEDCHGTPDAYGDLTTSRGTKLTHVRVEKGKYVLKSKVTGADHVIKQAKDFTNPDDPSYNAVAAWAMTSDHIRTKGGLECYTCHSAWQNNCWGCHFERDLREDALDYFAGRKTLGHPKTDKKIFLDFKSFQMGYNSEGKISPYVVGCQVMATVTDANGRKILDQTLPRTAEGRSGLALNAVNPHTTRRRTRSCIECHRSESSLGLGSENFSLSRDDLYVSQAGAAPGLEIIRRKDPSKPVVVGSLRLPDPRGLAVAMDATTGHGRYVYVADGKKGLVTVDVRVPEKPSIMSVIATTDARHLCLIAGYLFLADGSGGLAVFGLSSPSRPVRLATVPVEAVAVRHAGTYLYVAAGAAGLAIVDVLRPATPRIVARMDFNGSSKLPNATSDVVVFSHYGNPSKAGTKPFYYLAYVADGPWGVRVVDLSEPERPRLLSTIPATDARRLVAGVLYDAGSKTRRSLEREYLYVADGAGGLRVFDISSLYGIHEVGRWTGGEVVDVVTGHAFESPVNKFYAYLSVAGKGLTILDVSRTGAPKLVGSYGSLAMPGVGLCLERVRLDRLVDENGTRIKDSSHPRARPFTRAEIEKILRVRFPPSAKR